MITLSDLRYSRADNSTIDMIVTNEDGAFPFTYHTDDPNPIPRSVGDLLVGGSYTIAAYSAPAMATPEIISDRQFFQQLAALGEITQDEALTAVTVGTLPTKLVQFISSLPSAQQFPARMVLCGATQFLRHHPMVVQFGAALGWNDAQIDALWQSAAQL